MDHFDVVDARKAPRRRPGFDLIWNLLAVVLLLLTLCVGAVILLVFVNPTSTWNPFPPPTLVPPPKWPTPTSTLKMTLEPSWTPTIAIPTQTQTPRATNTPLVTATAYGLPTSNIPTMVATVIPGEYAFELMQGSPSFIPGSSFHPELGCDWIGVAGQVVGMNGEPIRFLIVHLGGIVDGEVVDSLMATGMAPNYGQAGFEFIIANHLVATNDSLWIQIEDVQGLPMSEKIYFDTVADCEKNLAVIYMQQVR